MRLTTLLLVAAAAGACTTRAVPQEHTYVDPNDQVFDLVTVVVDGLEGRVIHANRQMQSITASFPADIAGLEIFLEVRIERRTDETTVLARVHGGRQQLDQEVVEAFRQRFFDELDDLAASQLRRGSLAHPPDRPEGPTPAPWSPRPASRD